MLNKSTFRLVIILFEFFISALSNIFYIFFAFSLVILIHEFGLYYVGKRCGIGVKEFSIGFHCLLKLVILQKIVIILIMHQ